MASAAVYCTVPICRASNAERRSSVEVSATLANSLATAQALFEEVCAATVMAASLAGTSVSAASPNKATAVGRYESDTQKEWLSERSTPITMSTVPLASADSRSEPTSMTSSFSPKLSARAAAMSTSMPITRSEPEGLPAKGAVPEFTPTRNTPSCPMVGLANVGVGVGGV